MGCKEAHKRENVIWAEKRRMENGESQKKQKRERRRKKVGEFHTHTHKNREKRLMEATKNEERGIFILAGNGPTLRITAQRNFFCYEEQKKTIHMNLRQSCGYERLGL